tara:strand:- start:366 stop:740 length:375 start_codon:yes stop_codon:yes gene_type:complete
MENFRSSSQAMPITEQMASEHSVLAMRAAKKMSRTKQKAKTGRAVCHHLLQMINEADSRQPDPRVSRRYHQSAANHKVEGRLLTPAGSSVSFEPDLFVSDLFGSQELVGSVSLAANDRQFSLAF